MHIVATAVLMASGIELLVLGPQQSVIWKRLHVASFILWLGLMTIHVLAHAWSADTLSFSEVSPGRASRVLRLTRVLGRVCAAVQGFFGPVQAVLTVSSGRITNVSITAPQDNPTSQYINSQVVPLLKSETLRAQSANINGISGATVTSQAYYQSLQGALTAAHL